jgi:hypothetical protein
MTISCTIADDMAATFLPQSVQTKWDRATRFQGKLTPSAARALLKLQFTSDVESRMRKLLAKAKKGMISHEEDDEMNAYEQMACMLDILHARARRALAARKAS